MNTKIRKQTLNSFEFDTDLARRNEQIIRSMYMACLQQNQVLPTISALTEFVRIFNIEIIARQIGQDKSSDEVTKIYDELEDHNMFCMMGDYIRTVISKAGFTIIDEHNEVLQDILLENGIDRVPDMVVYGDSQNVLFSKFERMGMCAQGNVMNVRPDGIQYLGLGDGSE